MESMWYSNMADLKNWRAAYAVFFFFFGFFLYLLMKNCENFHKSIDF